MLAGFDGARVQSRICYPLLEQSVRFQNSDLPGIGTAVEPWHAASVDRSERAVCNQEQADHAS
jgi:hypothetical protein